MNCIHVGGPRDGTLFAIPDETAFEGSKHIVATFKPPYFHPVKHRYVFTVKPPKIAERNLPILLAPCGFLMYEGVVKE